MYNTCNVQKDFFLYHIFSSKAICTFKTLYGLMDSFFWLDTIHLGWSIVYIKGSQVIISNENCISFSEIVFVLANSVDPDEMLHYAAFHLGLHYLPRYTLRSQLKKNGNSRER